MAHISSLCCSTFTNGVSRLSFPSYPPPNFLRQHPNKPLRVSCKASNFYELLSLSSNEAGAQEIKSAYRKLALKYHPDVCRDPLVKKESQEMFVLLQTAYETLSDPVSRAEYDCTLGCRELFGHAYKGCTCSDQDGEGRRRRWESQIVELKNRSSHRAEQKDGSWGSRVRYVNRKNSE